MPGSVRIRRRSTDIAAFTETLEILPSDEVKLHIKSGVASAQIKRANGTVQTATTMLGGSFKSSTVCDSEFLTPKKRQKLVKNLRKEGHTQQAIANLVGVSQATVSNDLK